MPSRDNGLTASSYGPLVDVDPPVVDHVLELLRAAGVAAYAEPWAGVVEPYRNVRPPTRPQLRVYVDRAAMPLARDVVGRSLPALRADFLADAAARADREVMAAADVDAAWARIVAGWGATAAPGRREGDRPESAPGGTPDGRGTRADDGGVPAPGDGELGTDDEDGNRFRRGPDAPGPRGSGLSDRLIRRSDRWDEAARGDVPPTDPGVPGRAGDESRVDDDLDVWVERHRGHDDEGAAADDPDDHYVPPPPPPLPTTDTVGRFAWAGVLGGPGYLLADALLGLGLPSWVGLLAMAAFVAGLITLVARMKDRPDDGWDDGAVV